MGGVKFPVQRKPHEHTKALAKNQGVRIESPQAQPETRVESLFMLYTTFCGDTIRTAHASGQTEDFIKAMAAREGWDEKIKPILELKKSSRPGDVERAINRALNFVQAHQLRNMLERLLRNLSQASEQDFHDLVTSKKTIGGVEITSLDTRALADLAAALEKCHMMTYTALYDTPADRRKRDDVPSDDISGGELHAQIAKAMSTREVLHEGQNVASATLRSSNDK